MMNEISYKFEQAQQSKQLDNTNDRAQLKLAALLYTSIVFSRVHRQIR